jgi:hypothetical protein
MAPKAGLEPATSRLIPTSRDSTIEQIVSNPPGRFHFLDLPLALHGGGASRILLGPNELPRTVFPGELATNPVGAIVILHSDGQIARVADVKSAIWILKNVRPKHGAKGEYGSRGRARTCNITVNPDESEIFSGQKI